MVLCPTSDHYLCLHDGDVTFDPASLHSLTCLKYLSLWQNELAAFAFPPLPSLQELWIDHESLRHMPPASALQPVSGLTKLSLMSESEHFQICEPLVNICQCLPQLEVLELQQNHSSSWSAASLAYFVELEGQMFAADRSACCSLRYLDYGRNIAVYRQT